MPEKFLPAVQYTKVPEGWRVYIHLSKDHKIEGGIIDELPAKIKQQRDNCPYEDVFRKCCDKGCLLV